MEKKCKDYLHLYLGCYGLHGEQRVYISGFNIVQNMISNVCGEETISGDEIKLILRPLSDMTIEEGAWCLKETFFEHVDYPIKDFKLTLVGDGNPRISIDNDWFTESLTFGNKRGSIWSTDKNSANVKIQPKLFVYLLSKGFDLFGLIEKGEAIDCTNPIRLKT